MIWDSRPWKRELARIILALQRRKHQKRWLSTSNSKLEMEVFYSAYAVRKLLESYKLSDDLELMSVKAEEFPPIDKVADMMNWHRIHELYDLNQPTPRKLSLLDFCNQIIHSFVFIPLFEDTSANVVGFYVSSDRQKAKGLFYFNLVQGF